ncbi:MAG: methionyl-tRNA synthetase, methionyl-tRNA synthetase [candidate division WS6 bacterium GW2011_GWC1_33_20]|uniref:Methionine--tRNA ligase n=1 Tax=candidate division WS6 bacterium GW2011_GWC1_33_20 TaxID=1619089 RepID=A0A0G0CLI8_9BACT|nr:MAG: methionyl-tRNA synthetase, methionyl-tRNA synthetase [candidate division WS6 bacterium GW2011_GWE2_33_157]KKP44277.1 MAG: methionyl-tRNA synthetase, methionyl-tRNA synthetase [candidate division WS6 bacterium GW2011_GWC1_33_20]KKP45858.1 MAG: methionyl-tRNA synthetase, methionyl-tRNA synthetase [candidate division WS6 bacterium GW2011_GWF1_33_233]KKP55145.1 MAG: methionyl-tRNA synthetase, methionyl-tRNA synthetase [candidate division WS6 bacterium GW2011_WS6_33_547]KKP82651.1 MAG: Methi
MKKIYSAIINAVTMSNSIQQEKIFVGVSWPYASGKIHLGHLAGQNIACDVFSRYHRLKGNKVLMVSGSDSHGTPILFKAEELGIEPEQLIQQSHQEIVNTFKQLSLIYDNYTTTATENHKEVVQNIFLVLKEKGYLYPQKSKQYFDEKVNKFLPDRYVRGTCPNCGAVNARGDECPECGKFLKPEDLIDPFSTLSDTTPILKETEHFYLDLKKLQPQLSKWIDETSVNWRKWVREFSKGWIREGLEPREVTRDMKFGIPVPVEGWEDKVIYVWIEAVVGYLSAAIEWADKIGKPSEWEEYWKDPKCKHYYFIAGGNTPFHTIIWPAELLAYSEKYSDDTLWEKYKFPGETKREKLNLPYNVPSNKMLLYKGKKMSKGDGVGMDADSLLEKYNSDLIRFFFLRYAPENHDREFEWKDLIDCNNNELVANIGNFINRTLTFTQSKFNSVIPEGVLDKEVEESISNAFETIGTHIEKCEFVKASEALLQFSSFANKYFNDKAPWASYKEDLKDCGNTIYNSIQLVNTLRILIKPFMPKSSIAISNMLGLEEESDPNIELDSTGVVNTYENNWEFNVIESNKTLNQSKILFEKILE